MLVGNRQALGGGMSIEYWEVQAAGASQWPIVIEHTVSSGDGGSETMRVTTEVSRISVEQGFFDVPSSYFLHDLLER